MLLSNQYLSVSAGKENFIHFDELVGRQFSIGTVPVEAGVPFPDCRFVKIGVIPEELQIQLG